MDYLNSETNAWSVTFCFEDASEELLRENLSSALKGLNGWIDILAVQIRRTARKKDIKSFQRTIVTIEGVYDSKALINPFGTVFTFTF